MVIHTGEVTRTSVDVFHASTAAWESREWNGNTRNDAVYVCVCVCVCVREYIRGE